MDLGFASVDTMLGSMTIQERFEWDAFMYINSGQYAKDQERKNFGKNLRAKLDHLVVKKKGDTNNGR